MALACLFLVVGLRVTADAMKPACLRAVGASGLSPPAPFTPLPSSSAEAAALTRRAALLSAAVLASGGSPALASQLSSRVAQLDKSAEKRNSLGAPEKHIPTVSSAGSQLTMTVAHVMDPEKPHFIEYMWLKDATSDAVLAVQAFKATDAAPPTLTASIAKGKTVVPLLYCNLHGLWEGEPLTV